MTPHRPTDFRAPRKRFGQHFLRDAAIIQAIVAAIAPARGDCLAEIGPGRGALTLPLLPRVDKLDVIEIDRDMIAPLREKCATVGTLCLHEADALTFDFASLVSADQPLRLAGNLPYNISTPLIFHLLTFAEHISDMHFMVQKEVADRLAAAPGCSDYGRLSVMVQYHCDVVALFDVPPTAFHPPPKVMSSVIRLRPWRPKPCVAHSPEHFAMLVKTAFSQRRKTLRNTLKHLPGVPVDFPLDMQLRPEQVSVAEFVGLSNAMVESNE